MFFTYLKGKEKYLLMYCSIYLFVSNLWLALNFAFDRLEYEVVLMG